MRSWMAGSITLGAALVVFGFSMLISKVTGMFTLLDIVVWWPVVLILLGCEVLAAVLISKENPMKIRFSGGSVFLIAAVVCFSMVISAAGFAADLIIGHSSKVRDSKKLESLMESDFQHIRVKDEPDGIRIIID